MPLQTQGKRRSAAQDIPVKRFRVSRACDQCRIERSKCDGNQPQCAPCFESKRSCTYTSNPRKRGLPPGYIRTIELALALIFHENPDIEASLISRLGQENTVLLARDTKDSNRLHRAWRKSKFCRELNKTLTGEPEDDKAVSSDSDDEPQESGHFELSDVQPLIGITTARPPQPVANSPLVHRQPVVQASMPFPQLTPLPLDSWRLLDTYATYTQCWFPISEKLEVLKLSYSYPPQGLVLSPDMPDSGHHAEMWSMFALAAHQDQAYGGRERNHPDTANPNRLYLTTQGLIPNELGKFDLGHVKALLNLALFNLRSSRHDAAWLLVGAASRIFPTITSPQGMSGHRHAHVLASCFLLDSLLAILLDRRPYLEWSDLERVGKIEEDGLEEWQPWDGQTNIMNSGQSRLPTLALSSFNRLLSLINILRSARRVDANQLHNLTQQLTEWKASLSPKFDYVKSDSTTIPLTPPAALLQLAHFALALALSPSQAWLQRSLEILALCQDKIGLERLPSVVACLLDSIRRSSKNLPLDQATQLEVNKMIIDFTAAQSLASAQQRVMSTAEGRRASDRYPEVIPPPSHSFSHPSNLLDDLLPDMNSSQPPPPQSFSPLDTDFTSPAMDGYDPSISGDLESFFDELASLHGAKKLQNQPQFMQNLGFAPEVSMADLLATQSGQYMPMNSATFGAEHEGEPLQFPLTDYYNAS
ncbi:hypothetical protein BKA63DRAFT_463801 [Paraphoma chrysanthemicola]|nr:hypothetical protein BKA63DRAFT_463801 [Paraphoma chrysanthemicola]